MVEYVITLSWDEEASMWIAVNDEIPIAFENGSLDALIVLVQYAVHDVLQANNNLPDSGEVQLRFRAERVERLDCCHYSYIPKSETLALIDKIENGEEELHSFDTWDKAKEWLDA